MHNATGKPIFATVFQLSFITGLLTKFYLTIRQSPKLSDTQKIELSSVPLSNVSAQLTSDKRDLALHEKRL
jgi:hypothetical protein